MLLTRLVISGFLTLALTGPSQTRVLDLTKIHPSERRSMGVPGGRVGGDLGTKEPRRYDFPVRLKIESIKRVDDATPSILTIRVSNDGSSSLKIPSCLDPYAAFPRNAKGRLSLNFGVNVENSVTGKHSSDFVEVTSGSDAAQECFETLKPGENLLVVLRIDSPTLLGDGGKGQKTMTAFVEEWKFADSDYIVEETSERVKSENEITLP